MNLIKKPPNLNSKIEKFSFNAELKFIKNAGNTLTQKIGINASNLNITFVWGFLNIDINGDFYLSEEGSLNGNGKINLKNWLKTLSLIEDNKPLKPDFYTKINSALTFLASQTPLKTKKLAIPIQVDDNIISIGPLNIGEVDLNLF